MSFEYSIKALGWLKCFIPVFSFLLIENWYFVLYGSFAYRYILSLSGWLHIKLNNAFVFPDPEPPINSILYGWSGRYSHFKSCSIFFTFV